MIKNLEKKVEINKNFIDKFLNNLEDIPYLNHAKKQIDKKQSLIKTRLNSFSNLIEDYYHIEYDLYDASDNKINEYSKELKDTYNLLIEVSNSIEKETNFLGTYICLKFFKNHIDKHNPPKNPTKW